MNVSQTQFTSALLDPDQDAPHGLQDPAGRPAGRRFAVYRNNVAVSLTEALETAFPIVRKLVGDEFFRAAAGVFLRQHPPESPLMMRYGQEFPAFLSRFPPAASLGYLPDVAGLEIALRKSYHAADATALNPETLHIKNRERLAEARLVLAPSVRVVQSDWPIYGIWKANTDAAAPKPLNRAESALITRPEFDPQVTLISSAEATSIQALMDGKPLLQALCAGDEMPDLSRLIGLLLQGGAITQLIESNQT